MILDSSQSTHAILQWYSVTKGRLDGGELLFAAELYLVSDSTTIMLYVIELIIAVYQSVVCS